MVLLQLLDNLGLQDGGGLGVPGVALVQGGGRVRGLAVLLSQLDQEFFPEVLLGFLGFHLI